MMDATAGAAIGSRRGLGKVRQIDTVFPRVRETPNRGRVAVGKKDTEGNAGWHAHGVRPGSNHGVPPEGNGLFLRAGKHELGLKA